MRRALAVATLTLASAPALAAGPDDAKTEAAKPEFTSGRRGRCLQGAAAGIIGLSD